MEHNLVLIGMPGAGKTTLGKHLAAVLSRPFWDMDAVLCQQLGMTIADFFAQNGEAAFRRHEHEAALAFSHMQGIVLATGGGIVLDESNMHALSQTGRILWIVRPLHLLALGEGRPLSQSRGDVERMWRIRAPLYARYAHGKVDNKSTLEASLAQALAVYNGLGKDGS